MRVATLLDASVNRKWRQAPTIVGHLKTLPFLRPVYAGDFCRAKVASSFKHVQNPRDIAATNHTENRTWFTPVILKLQL